MLTLLIARTYTGAEADVESSAIKSATEVAMAIRCRGVVAAALVWGGKFICVRFFYIRNKYYSHSDEMTQQNRIAAQQQ